MKNIRTEEELVALQTHLVTDDDRDACTTSMQSRFFSISSLTHGLQYLRYI